MLSFISMKVFNVFAIKFLINFKDFRVTKISSYAQVLTREVFPKLKRAKQKFIEYTRDILKFNAMKFMDWEYWFDKVKFGKDMIQVLSIHICSWCDKINLTLQNNFGKILPL